MSTFSNVTSFDNDGFEWNFEPSSWKIKDETGVLEGSCGSHEILEQGKILRISPPSKKDFWARTFYNPILIKNDASGLLYTIPISMEATIKVDFEYEAKSQFDQAGLFIHVDNDHWVKAGIEYCDGNYKLSVVVCNKGYSDWSTQPWANGAAKLRIHKVNISSSIVVEAAPLQSEKEAPNASNTVKYESIRIAHLSTNNGYLDTDPYLQEDLDIKWKIGPFAACPTSQFGCTAAFSNFFIGPLEETTHSCTL